MIVSLVAGARQHHELPQPAGIGLARQRGIAADHVIEQAGDLQAVEDAIGRPLRLVGQHGERGRARQVFEHLARALVETRVIEQPLVVQLEEPRQCRGIRRIEAGRRQRPLDQQRRPFADHRR